MTPRRTIAFALAVVLFPAGMAWGLEETWTTTKNGGGKWLYNVGAPGSAPTPATAVTRAQDVAPGACIPKSPGANTLPFICSVPETDYITPAYPFGGQLGGTPAAATVLGIRETGGPTLLTIGAIANGALTKRLGSTFIGATPGIDFLAPLIVAAGNYDRVSVSASGLVTGGAAMVVANVTALEALTGANYRDGSSVYVSSVAADFVLHTTSSVTVDHITIASVSGSSGARWIRRPTPDGYWYQTGTQFYLGGAGASDENNCTAAITPCATAGELRRRLKGRIMPAGATQSFTINIDSTFAGGDFDPITAEIDPTRNAGTVVTFLGTPAVTAIGTVASAVAHNYAGNQLVEIVVSGYDWSTKVGKIIRKVGTTGTSSVTSVVVADLGGGRARIMPSNLNTISVADLTTGDVVEELTTLPRVMGARGLGFGATFASMINFDPTGTSTSFETNQGNSMFIIGSYVKGATAGGGSDTSGRGIGFYGCSVSRAQNFRGSFAASRSAFFSANINVANSVVGRNEWQDSVLVNSTLSLSEYMHTRFHSLGVYGLGAGAAAITLADGASVTFTDAIYGTGNNASSTIFSFITRGAVQLAGGTPVTTSGSVATVPAASVTITAADLPYYEDIYGNSIFGAQNVDPYKRMAVAGGDITSVAGAASNVTAFHETSGPTKLTIGAIANGALTKRSGSTFIGATAGTDYQAAGNYITALTGDVTAAGPGSVAATIAADAVTYAKMQNVSAASRLLGRGSAAGAGDPQELTIGTGLSLSGTVLSATGAGTVTSVTATLPVTSTGGTTPLIALQYDNVSLGIDGSNALIRKALTGDVTASDGSNATTIASNAVSNAKLRDSGALSVIGRNVNTTGDPADISAVAGSDCVFRENGSTLACGTVNTAGITSQAVTNVKLAGMPTQTFKGRTTAGTGDPEDLTATQATAMLNVFSSTLKGLAPLSGGGTSNFLRADGTWATPPGTGGGGTLTAVTASLPLTSSGGTAPNIALNYDAATITLNGSNQIQVAAQTGDVTKPAGSNVTTIAAQAVIYSKIQNLATDHLLGRDSAGAGSTEEIAVTNGIGFTGAGSIGLTTTGVGAVSCTNCSLTVGTDGRLTAASSGATPEVPLTFSTGLTRSTNTITANISTGVSGGQTIIGGTASGNSLTYSSTSNATKGTHIWGTTTGMVYNEATGHLALGVASPDASATAQFTNNTNGIASIYVSNNSAGTGAYSGFVAGQSSSASGTTPTLAMYMPGSGNTSSFYPANSGVFELYGGSVVGGNGNMVFSIVESSGGYLWKTGLTPATKMSLTNAGVLTVNGLGTGLVKTTSGAFANASASDIAAAQVWPAAPELLISTGASSAPGGVAGLNYDSTGNGFLELSDDIGIAQYNSGAGSVGNYERVTATWNSGQWLVETEAHGTGVLNNLSMRFVAHQVDLCNGSCASFFSVQPTGQLLQQSNKAVTSAAAAVADSITLTPAVTVSGSTAITTNPFSGVTIASFGINSAANVNVAVGLDVSAPQITGGGAITTSWAILSRGTLRVAPGGGNPILDVPGDATAGVDTTIDGRIMINIPGVGTKYIRYYND